MSAAADTELSLLKVLKQVFAHKWLVAAIAGAVVITTFFLVNAMTPIYRSTATVLVETSQNRVVSIDQIVANVSSNREFFATQAEFLQSRDVTARVIRDMKLVDHPLFDPDARQPSAMDGLKATVKGWISEVASLVTPEPAAPAAGRALAVDAKMAPIKGIELTEGEAQLISVIQDSLDVRPVRSSQLITVSFASPDNVLAAEIANGIADAYIQADLDARFEVTQRASLWLNDRLEQLRAKLEKSEAGLQRLREIAGVVRNPGTSLTGSVRQMDTASDRLVQARVARAQIEQIYRQVLPNAPNRYIVPQVFNNPSVVRSRENLVAAERRLDEIKHQLGTQHPEYLRADSEFKSARQNWIGQSEAVISSIAKEFEVARSTEVAVEKEIQSAKSLMSDIDRKELSLEAAERDTNTLRQLYQTFLARVKETSATSDFQSPVARIIDPAIPASRPFRPAKFQLIVVAGFLGLALGAALALLLERLNATIRSSDEVDSLLDQPLLSAIPIDRNVGKGDLLRDHPTRSDSLYGESIRTAVTSVQLTLLDVTAPIVGFTSSVPGEGKSTIAVSFAIQLAARKRVLLIDADLRRPSVAGKLGLDQSGPGLSELLRGSATFDEALIQIPDMSLTVMSSGRHPKNPLDLLFSESFERILAIARSRFDMVVVDTPPIELVSDALLIGRACSGMVYVVKSHSTEIPVIRRSLDRIAAANIRVLGVALNAHNFKKAARYYGESSALGKYAYTYDGGPASAKG